MALPRLVATMDELNIEGDTIDIASVDLSNSYDYFGCDMIQCPMGVPAVLP